MGTFKFLHAADFHLNLSFQNNDSFDAKWLKLMHNSSWKALDNIIELAIKSEVDAFVFSGDIFDAEGYCPAARRRFIDRIASLTSHKIKVYIIYGNHDIILDHETIRQELEVLDGVYIFPVDKLVAIDHYKDGQAVARLYGRAFKDECHETNPLDEYAEVIKADQGAEVLIKIALAHGRVGEVRSILPCASFDPEEMQSLPIDYWAMGHVHKSKVNIDRMPFIVNPGSIQGSNIDELNSKGCYIVEFKNHNLVAFDYHAIDAVRWRRVSFNMNHIMDAFKDRISYDLILDALQGLMQAQIHEARRPVIVQLLFEGKVKANLLSQEKDFAIKIREAASSDKVLVFEVIDNTRIELTDLEEAKYPIIKRSFQLIDAAISKEEVFASVRDYLVELYGDASFQRATGTGPGQRGRGQWKHKKITSDSKRWLQASKNIIANNIILASEEEEDFDLDLVIENLNRARGQLFQIEPMMNKEVESIETEGLATAANEKTINQLIEEYMFLKERQNQIQAKIRVQNRQESENEKDEKDLLVINQETNRSDGELFTSVRKWTVLSMAVWALEQSKLENY